MFMDGDKTFSNNNTGMIYNFFNEHFGEVRGMLIGNEAWVVGKDVAKALGYVDRKHAILDHVDEDDRINSKTQGCFDPEFGQRGTWLINESGIYSLVFSSKLKSAKKFKRWVTKEVLPTIRATGTYVDPNHAIIRELSKDIRENEVHAIAELIRYGKENGMDFSKGEEDHIYARITAYINKVCGIPRGERDLVNTVKLVACIGCEAKVGAVILYGIRLKLSFEEILHKVKNYICDYITMVSERQLYTITTPLNIQTEDDRFVQAMVKPKKLVLSINGVEREIKTISLAG